ncbi:hypothetical protein [Cellulomonas sp. S1-8]|uniref:hypothetical protein n=1 Tax=Cellulomonas sp. S1-8 TaxID=2904790 RepID=UPI0022434025|nr:hypothetical protein [Cellulomonas sp. S1-8]UZN03311.1 hypothetical protein OKX07_20050 [Cellulomonas sp. S1-8]
MEIVIDEGRRRHVLDFVTLATLIRPSDDIAAATRSDRARIANMLGNVSHDTSWRAVDGGADGIERLKLALDVEKSASPTPDRQPAWSRRHSASGP